MAHVEKSVEVEAPIAEVFRTWTAYEDYPRFMEGIRQVRKLSPYRTRWVADFGAHEEWDARITDTTTNRRLAWISESGERHDAEVVLEPLGRDRTRVYFALDYEPQGTMKSGADRLGVLERRTEGDLRRFKQYVESRGAVGTTAPRRMEARMHDRDFREQGQQQFEQGKNQITQMLSMPRLDPLEWISAGLLTAGGINWGLEGLFDYDVVDELFDEDSKTAKVIYGAIAFAAVYTFIGLVRIEVMSRRKEAKHREEQRMKAQPEMSERRASYV